MSKNNEILIRKKIREFIKESYINEADIAWGHEEIDTLKKSLGPNEYIWLDDRTGELTGQKVSKKEYLKRMLKYALDQKKWDKINAAILFLDTQM